MKNLIQLKSCWGKKNNMKKNDLKHGNAVKLRNGDTMLFCWHFPDEILVNLEGRKFITFDSYRKDLTDIDNALEFDIMKVYKDYTCKELLWERKEKPKLTEDEKVILRNLPKRYKWIARDKSDWIFIYENEPIKCCRTSWGGCMYTTLPFKHLFQFIKWEDEEPYLIEDLLGK